MTVNKRCRVCEDELVIGENLTVSQCRICNYICKGCRTEQARLWRKENPDKARAIWTRSDRKMGKLPMSENKKCSQYLGVYVTERLLKHYFKDVEVMPYGNKGFDFKCNRDKLIDAKSACLSGGRWSFAIKRNEIPDFFLCAAFDNRDDLNPLHVWLIPGSVVNHLKGATIRPGTVHKWDKYMLDINKASACCNEMKNNNHT